MKTLGTSESLVGFISVCPSADGKRSGAGDANGLIYSRGFQSMLNSLEEEDCIEECGHVAEKKRRLSVDQVKALEKNFEVENKLEPERKLKLAQELGLQPRQVAVWFQNRRARWKTKQLERDYSVLKAKYDSLKLSFDSLQRDKEALLSELTELKSQLGEEEASVKDEILKPTSENKVFEQGKISGGSESPNPNKVTVYGDLKDGSSDSDSSAILNDDSNNSPINAAIDPSLSSLRLNSSSPSSIGCFQLSDSKTYHQHHQFVKMEEHNFLGTEDSCNFFSDDQPPSLHWYCPDQWN